MSCPRCGQTLPTGSLRSFCPSCGARLTQPAKEASRPAPSEPAQVTSAASRRSWTQIGALLVSLAIGLSVLPPVAGIGFVWSLVMLAGAVLVLAEERRAAGQPGWPVVESLPAVTRHPLVPLLFTVLTCAHAALQLGCGVAPPLWLAAAVFLGVEQVRRLAPPPVSSGQRLLVLGAAGLCVLSLLLPWTSGSREFGGWSTRYISQDTNVLADQRFAGTIQNEYNPLAVTRFSYEVAGQNQTLASFAAVALFLLVLVLLWSATLRSVPRSLPLWLSGGLTFWYLFIANGGEVGSWLFFPGLVVLAILSVRHFSRVRTEQSGVESSSAIP